MDHGHHWFGIDISQDMLDIANEDEDTEGSLILNDMGQGLSFKAGTFDGAVSNSALQWLCNEDMSCHKFRKRLIRSIGEKLKGDGVPGGASAWYEKNHVILQLQKRNCKKIADRFRTFD